MEDVGFSLLLQEKRHKEIIKILTGMLSLLDKNPSVAQLEKNKNSVEKLLDSILKTNETIPKIIETIGNSIINKLEKLDNSKQSGFDEWEFSINRNESGYISTVKAKAIK